MAKVTGRTVKTYMSMACKVECESCGTSFVCEQTQKLEAGETAIIGEIDAGLTTGSAFDKLEKKKAEAISKFKQMKKDSLPTAKCPKCGYWQSWMIASEKNSRIQLLTALLGIIIFAAIFGGSAILKLKGDPAVVTFIAALASPVVVYFVVRRVVQKADINKGRSAQPVKLPVLGILFAREDTRPVSAIIHHSMEPEEFNSYQVLNPEGE